MEEDSSAQFDGRYDSESSDTDVIDLIYLVVDDYGGVMKIADTDLRQMYEEVEPEQFATFFVTEMLIKMERMSALQINIRKLYHSTSSPRLRTVLNYMARQTSALELYFIISFHYIMNIISDYYCQILTLLYRQNYENRIYYLKNELKYQMLNLEMLEFEAYRYRRHNFRLSAASALMEEAPHLVENWAKRREQLMLYQSEMWEYQQILAERIEKVEESIESISAQISELYFE